MILSALALVVCYPFDRGRRTVHELSRILVRIFFFIPPFWRQRVIGRELIDRKRRYVIVVNHNTVIDIPALYYIPLNFRWVSKREVFKTPFFRAVPRPARRHLHQPRPRRRGAGADGPRRENMDFARGFGGRFPRGHALEGRRDPPFKAGAFTLAKEAGVEILPVVLDGTKTLIKKNLAFNWGNRITVRVLPPSRPRRSPLWRRTS